MEWAGIVLVNPRGEILLNLRDNDPSINWPNQWDVIGGTVEQGEPPDECVVRETLEETGEDLTAFGLFKVYDVPLPAGEARLHVYSGRLDKPASQLLIGEGQEHRFFPIADIEGLDVVRGIDMVLRELVASPAYRALAS